MSVAMWIYRLEPEPAQALVGGSATAAEGAESMMIDKGQTGRFMSLFALQEAGLLPAGLDPNVFPGEGSENAVLVAPEQVALARSRVHALQEFARTSFGSELFDSLFPGAAQMFGVESDEDGSILAAVLEQLDRFMEIAEQDGEAVVMMHG